MLPSIETILLVLSAGFALAATPGPSMLYVLSRSIEQDYKAGLASSAGMALGGMVHAVIAASGIASLIVYTPSLYALIKYAGALYLFYLGLDMLRHKILAEEVDINHHLISNDNVIENNKTKPKLTHPRIFIQGLLVEIGNPKTILFFLAFIPSFVSADSQHPVAHLLVLGLLVPLTALPADIIVSLAGGKLASKLKSNLKTANAIGKIAGLFLIFLSIKLVFL